MFKAFLLTIFFTLAALSADKTTFVYGVPDPIASMKPFATQGVSLWVVEKLMYDFLLIEIPGQKDHYRSGLAKSWSVSKNKKVYEFELRQAVWSDGTPITAEDVKFSLEHMFDERFRSDWKASFVGIEKIQILSPTKIKITTKEPYYELWKNISVFLRIIPKHWYQNPTDPKYNRQNLGSGPYKLVDFDSGKKLRLEKNEKWWGWKESKLAGAYNLLSIEFRSFLNNSTVASYFKKNELDVYPIKDFQLVKTLKGNTEVKAIKDPNKSVRMVEQLYFNLSSKPLDDINFRNALNLLLDRKNMCPKVYNSNTVLHEHNPKKGLAMLKSLGWVDSDKNGFLDKDGEQFNLNVTYNSTDSDTALTALKESFRAYGILVTLNPVDPGNFWQNLKEKKFQTHLDQSDLNERAIRSSWHSNGFYNNLSFKSKKVDQLLEKADATFEAEKRAQMTKEIRQEIAKQTPALLLCEVYQEDYLVNSKHLLKNLKKGVSFWGWF